MNSPSDTIETQVAVLEARLDGRATSMETTFANFVKLMDERKGFEEERHRTSEARMDRMEAMIAEIRAAVAGLRVTIIVTGISSVLAATLGIASFNGALYANMITAFQAGGNMTAERAQVAATQAELKRQAEQTAAILRRIEEQQNKATPSK